MQDVYSLGEILIDFTPCGQSERGRNLFECNPGGAPANMLSCLAQFGYGCHMIGRVGRDGFGDMLKRAIAAAGVDAALVQTDPTAPTTLAVVSLNAAGDRSFSFYRDDCADTRISMAELPDDLLTGAALAHVGTISMTHEPARTATLEFVMRAERAGVPVSFDPNYRPLLWNGDQPAREAMRTLLPHCDMVKMAAEEVELLTGEPACIGAKKIMAEYSRIRVLFVTMGADGSAYYLPGDISGTVTPCSGGHIVDTTGAGDYFFGGALSVLLQAGTIDETIARAACERGNRCGYHVACERGALGVRVPIKGEGLVGCG